MVLAHQRVLEFDVPRIEFSIVDNYVVLLPGEMWQLGGELFLVAADQVDVRPACADCQAVPLVVVGDRWPVVVVEPKLGPDLLKAAQRLKVRLNGLQTLSCAKPSNTCLTMSVWPYLCAR